MNASGLYACNVFHYRHVVRAMQDTFDTVTLATRYETTSESVDRARRWHLPSVAVDLLNRRAVDPLRDVRRVSLGPGQLLLPLMARVDSLNRLDVLRWSIDQQSRAVAKYAGGHEVMLFMEGLGHRAFHDGFSGRSICERRHFHHEVLEGDPGAVGDFPFTFRPDPIGDFLDYEYEKADLICVYSNVARQSFLDRGFDAERVVVAPLGVPSMEYNDRAEVRDPHLIAYVGRCDAFKGIDVAAAAVELLGAPYRLHVAGPAAKPVREWLATKQHVTYRGILSRDELTRLYRRAGYLMAPSIESFGYAAIEGAAHGARLICASTTGASEFLPTATHGVLEGREPHVWAQAVEELAPGQTDSELQATRESVDRLKWEASAAAFARILQRLDRL